VGLQIRRGTILLGLTLNELGEVGDTLLVGLALVVTNKHMVAGRFNGVRAQNRIDFQPQRP
jgi:hypothetical protein